MDVRPVRPHEHGKAGALIVDAYRTLPGGHLSDDYARLLADVARRAQESEVLVAVARADEAGEGEVCGCVTFVPGPTSPWAELLEPGEAGIRMLAVRPDAQGRGAGRALVGACIARARALGCKALVLHTTPWMTAAHRLYEAAGFVRFPARDWVPAPDVPLLAYRLELEPSADRAPHRA